MLNKRGFSLVELMVVVAIIEILAAIAVPNFQKFAAKSKQSEIKADFSALYSAERSFYAEWQQFSGDFQQISYAPTGKLRYRHGFSTVGPPLPQNFSNFWTQYAWLSSDIYCNAHNNPASADYCTEILLPIAPTALPANSVTVTAFTASATADLSGGVHPQDQWTIDQAKTLVNTQTGY